MENSEHGSRDGSDLAAFYRQLKREAQYFGWVGVNGKPLVRGKASSSGGDQEKKDRLTEIPREAKP